MNQILTSDERLWGMLCHLSAFAFFIFPFGNILGPLIIYLIKKDKYPFVKDQGLESLNFQISLSIYAVISAVLVLFIIGIVILIVVAVVGFILVIVASVKANEGIAYRYPFKLDIIK